MRVRGIDRVVQGVGVHDGRLSPGARRQLMVVVMVMMCVRMRQVAQFVAQDARDGADTGHVCLVADVLAQQTVPDLPRKDARVLLLQLANVVDHFGGGHTWLGTANGSRQN